MEAFLKSCAGGAMLTLGVPKGASVQAVLAMLTLSWEQQLAIGTSEGMLAIDAAEEELVRRREHIPPEGLVVYVSADLRLCCAPLGQLSRVHYSLGDAFVVL